MAIVAALRMILAMSVTRTYAAALQPFQNSHAAGTAKTGLSQTVYSMLNGVSTGGRSAEKKAGTPPKQARSLFLALTLQCASTGRGGCMR